MDEFIVDKPGVKTMFKFGNIFCILDGEGYAVFRIDRAAGRQEMYGETTLSPHRAWEQFWDAVDTEMRQRLEDRFGPSVGGLWVDPDSTGRYVTNLKSPVIHREYQQRCADLNGRFDSPLNEEDRLKFEMDMIQKYGEHYPIPPALKWKVEGIKIQYGKAEYIKRHPQQVC